MEGVEADISVTQGSNDVRIAAFRKKLYWTREIPSIISVAIGVSLRANPSSKWCALRHSCVEFLLALGLRRRCANSTRRHARTHTSQQLWLGKA